LTTSASPPSVRRDVSSPLDRLGARVQAKAAALVGRPLFWVTLITLSFSVLLGRTMVRMPPAAPELRLPLPAFTLLDERAQPFGLDDLRGKVWVADFIFTSCAGPCPKLTQRMAEIQHRTRNMGDAFHLVSFTVDPENDTPPILAAYAASYHANPRRWTFATGPVGDVETTVIKGFKIPMGREQPDDRDGGADGQDPTAQILSIFHGEKLVLVDREGRIRGYYDADDAGIDDLLHNAGILANLDESHGG
jgi:protein SCO1